VASLARGWNLLSTEELLSALVNERSVMIAHLLLVITNLTSGVTKRDEEEGAVAPWRSMLGGTKQPRQKYHMTNDYKSKFDKFSE